MRFARPEILFALLLVPAWIPIVLWSIRRRRRSLERFGEPGLLDRLTPRVPWEWWLLRRGLLAAALVFLLIALAEPKWGSRMENLQRRGIDIVVALDTSASMLAEDIAPNRLERARGEIKALLRSLHGDRVALVPFAGTSYVHCPLTSDYSAVRLFLDILDTELLPVPGSAIGDAIRTALKAFPEGRRRHQVIILLTDGEDHDSDPLDAARTAADRGVRIFPIGIGSASGDLIPVRQDSGTISEYKKDEDGNIVTTRLDENTLEEIAFLTGGAYYRSAGGQVEIESLAEDIQSVQKREYEERSVLLLAHRFQIPLMIAILLLAAEIVLPRSLARWSPRRRRVTAGPVLGLLLLLIPAGAARAETAARLVRDGNQLYDAGEYEAAMKKYTEAQLEVPEAPEVRFNLGDALFRQGKFAAAVDEYRRARQTTDPVLAQAAQFNIGNALFRLERLPEAVTAFEQALERDPDDLEAKRNLEIALARIEEQEQQQDPQQEPSPDADGDPQEDSSGERQPPEDSDGADPSGSPPPPGDEAPPGDRLSSQEAMRILDALQEDEKDSLRRGLRLPEKRPARGNDW